MKRFNNILCIVDPDQNSDTAIVKAINIADSQQADLTVLSVLDIPRFWMGVIQDEEDSQRVIREAIEDQRKKIKEKLTNQNCEIDVKIDVLVGIKFITIIQSVIKNNYDLLIKCCDSADWINRLFGSDDVHLLRKCPCPVLMMKPDSDISFQNILATVDVNDDFPLHDEDREQSELNKKVLDYTVTFALSDLAEMHIGSVWEAYAEDFLRHSAFSNMPDEDINHYSRQARQACVAKLDSLVREMNKNIAQGMVEFLGPKVHLVKGIPSKEIPVLAAKQNIDLIVMGTVARTGIPGFIIGNTAESILEQVQCSVLAIKPDGFQTPVQLPTD